MFCLLCPVVVVVSAKLVREGEVEVEPLVSQAIDKTASEVRFGMLCCYSVCLICIFGHFFYIIAVGVLCIGIELRASVVGIDASKLYEVEGTVRASDLMDLRTADDFSLCAVECYDFVFVVREIESGVPAEVLCLNVS